MCCSPVSAPRSASRWRSFVDELKRLEVLSSDADLSKVGGIDIAITDRSVDVQATNVDDIVNLEVTATAKATLKGEELPIGAWIRDAIGDQDLAELDEEIRRRGGHVPDHRGPQGRRLVPQPRSTRSPRRSVTTSTTPTSLPTGSP